MDEDLIRSVKDKTRILGKAGLHAVFPDEFEYYHLSFELVDSLGASVDYFSFPVLPSALREKQREISGIKKTAGGISVIDNPSFVPVDISFSGTFGRGFAFLVNGAVNGASRMEVGGVVFTSGARPSFNKSSPEYNSFAKRGYGCVKILERLKDKSSQLDKYNKPYKLVFYNSITGNNYIVKFLDFSHSQNVGMNLVPAYEVALRAVGRLGDSPGPVHGWGLARRFLGDVVQRRVNSVFSSITRKLVY